MSAIVWKFIKGYNSEYRINNDGEVESCKYGYWRKMAQTINKGNGYFEVSLSDGCGKAKHFTIHRLLAIYFLDKVKGKNFVNHKDGNKLNNKLTNLEWCTKSENGEHAYKMGLNKGCPKEKRYFYGKSGSKHPSSKPLIVIFKKEIKTISFASIIDAKKYLNVAESYFREIVSGRKKSNLYSFQFI
jgi:HNH endonuclease/NUMOD4 motif